MVTQARCEALAEILAEAEKLKMYRLDGATYSEKCDGLFARINSVLGDLEVEDLSTGDIDQIKSIKEMILREEMFAQSYANLRDPNKWFGSIND